ERKRMLVELQQKNEQLERANTELHEADALKSAFIQVASHELRTPLAILTGLSKLALTSAEMSPRLHELLDRIERSTVRLNRLVDQILTMLSAQKFDELLDRVTTDVTQMVREAADDVRPFVELRKQSLELNLPQSLGTMNLDEQKIRDGLNHLLLNAIKFTPDGGRISVGARRSNGEVEITVSDTACGGDAQSLPRL